MRSRLLSLFVILFAIFIIVNGFFSESASQRRISKAKIQTDLVAEKERQKHVETADIMGFEEVVKANDGDMITVQDFIDIKFLCHDVTEDQQEVCTAAIGGDPTNNSMLIKLNLCSETKHSNCIVWKTSTTRGLGLRDIYVLDKNGEKIDFEGQTLLEKPNTWTSYPQQLRLTGIVTRVNGKGRFLEPIQLIEAAK